MKKIVIDAANAILGRLCSYAVKQALLGKDVVIVNCEDAIITGNKRSIINHYMIRRKRGGHSLKGPHFPKDPERIVKRTVRGMLDYKYGRGASAFSRIICYNKVPFEYESVGKIVAGKEKLGSKITLLELSREI